jgi:nicotinate-nucleotide--dimethylbenzimidazole phosphoribosyltransferase
MAAFDDARSRVRPVNAEAARAADARQARLTKPAGALGRLEALGSRLAAIAGVCPPPVPASPAVAVFAGDHGVLAEGVTSWPAEVTAQMVANFLAGGAAINVFAREVGASVTVVDVGVATAIPPVPAASGSRFVDANVRLGTGNLAVEPAMTQAEAALALDAGAATAAALVAEGADCLVTGDMGIGNTTPSAALVAAFTGRPARMVTGRGTGISDMEWERKATAVERGLERAAAALSVAVVTLASAPPMAVLAEVGGLEIAAIAGFVVGAAAAGVPVIVDGVIALAGALTAVALVPDVAGYLVAGHRSTEPGASVALAHLELEPLLDLGLRLGEGTGACLAIPMLRAAARVLSEMATFDDAGVATLDG